METELNQKPLVCFKPKKSEAKKVFPETSEQRSGGAQEREIHLYTTRCEARATGSARHEQRAQKFLFGSHTSMNSK